jgi:hypothetical protein
VRADKKMPSESDIRSKKMTTNWRRGYNIRAVGLLIAAFGWMTGAHGQITTPAPGSVLNSGTVMFTWNPVSAASSYYLGVGTAPGLANVFSRNVGLVTSQSVSGIPLGGPIYVTETTIFGPPKPFSLWANVNYTYNYTYATAGSAAVLISPKVGYLLCYPETFTWTTGSGATEYWLMVGTSPGGRDLWSGGTFATSATVPETLTNLLNRDYVNIFVRLFTLLGPPASGVWVWNDYTYFTGFACGF